MGFNSDKITAFHLTTFPVYPVLLHQISFQGSRSSKFIVQSSGSADCNMT